MFKTSVAKWFFCTFLQKQQQQQDVTLLINDFDLLWDYGPILTASYHLDRLINHDILLEKKKMLAD